MNGDRPNWEVPLPQRFLMKLLQVAELRQKHGAKSPIN